MLHTPETLSYPQVHMLNIILTLGNRGFSPSRAGTTTVAGSSTTRTIATRKGIVMSVDVSWRKPTTGCFKCNFDASFSTSMNCVGFRMCIHDDKGWYVLAQTFWTNPIRSTNIGEALSLLYAIQFVYMNYNYQMLILSLMSRE